eukprot:GHRR01003669.1.p1 GENE.GHRR01003669.1~~GHRR01003669.1.p1  ORF type:complete len:1144 (+),score=472.39 GHRR01003669.1:203-3634(+)
MYVRMMLVESGPASSATHVASQIAPSGLHAVPESDAKVADPEPPLQPLQPEVELPNPNLLSTTGTAASFTWQAACWSLPPCDQRQAEYQERCVYSLEYELQLQQTDVGPPTAAETPEKLLQQVPAACKSGNWKAVAVTAGPQQEVLQVTGLRSGRFYAARLVATARVVIDGSDGTCFPATSSEVVPFRSTPTSPGQMQAPALAQRARNALKLKWNKPDETGGEAISQYELLISPQPASWDGPAPDQQGFAQVYIGDERSFKLGRLGPGQRFSFKIRSSNVLGCGPWSLPSTFTTQASVPAAPDPPRQVASTKDSATLVWHAPADNGAAITCYQLEVDDGRQGEFRLAYTGTETKATVNKLQSGLQYRCRLRAENSEGYSMWSANATATTAATVPSSPVGLAVVGKSRTSVTLTWKPPSSDGGSLVTAYQVQLQAKTKVAAASLGNDWIIIYDSTALATTFSALQGGCQYLVRVAARNAAGQGQYCLPLQLCTAEDTPMAPAMPEANVAATSLLLSWTPPAHDGGSPITGYKVEMRCSPGTSSSTVGISPHHSLAIPEHFLGIYSGADTCVQVTDLLPGTTYEFRAAALNSQGAGGWSHTGTATTLPAAPLPPPIPQLLAATSSSLSVGWVEPYGQGSPVTSYTLNMARLGQVGSSSSSSTSSSASTISRVGSSNGFAIGTALPNGVADNAQHVELHDDAASSTSSGTAAGDKLRWETVYTGPATSAEVKNLQPASRYLFRVRAHNSIGGSIWGEALATTTSPAAPSQPCALSPEPLSSQEVQLTWKAPVQDNGAPISAYQLEMAQAAGSSTAGGSTAKSSSGSSNGSGWTKVWQGTAQVHAVDGLLPGRTYSWRLRALNCCGPGPWCEAVKASTLPAEPAAPPKPTFSQRTATSVKVRWEIPLEENGAAVVQYQVQVRQAAGVQQQEQQLEQQQLYQWQQVYCGSELSHRVTALQPGCTYDMRVAAVNAIGAGPWSDVSSVVTLLRPPLPPVNVSAQCSRSADTAGASAQPLDVLVSWPPACTAPAGAEAVGYEVEAAPAAGNAHPPVKATAKQTSTSLTGLQPGVTYNVRVRSVGAAGTGHSNWSSPVTVMLPPSAPQSAASDGYDSPSLVAGETVGEGLAGCGGDSGLVAIHIMNLHTAYY